MTMFKETKITPAEIIYAKSGISFIVLFMYLLIRRIYVLELDIQLRSMVLIRALLVFAGMTFFYFSLNNLDSLSLTLIPQFSALGISHFITLKQERSLFQNVLAMALCLISLIMTLIYTIDQTGDDDMVYSKIKGFGQAVASGVILSIVS